MAAHSHAELTSDQLNALLAIDDAREFREFLDANPSLMAKPVHDHLRELAKADIYGITFAHILELLRRARSAPDAAWATFAAARGRAKELDAESALYLDEIEAAVAERRHDDVIALAERALPLARGAGNGGRVCWLLHRQGLAFVGRSSPMREDDLERAIEKLEAALELALSDELVDTLMHLALAYSERLYGDRAENLERAIELLRFARQELELVDDPESLAIVSTNLAVMLISRRRGDELEDLREAIELCELALTFRSPERNAVDWAHTQLNLGEALGFLARRGAADPTAATAAYERILNEQDRLADDRWLVGGAHQMLGAHLLRAADPDPEAIVDAHQDHELAALLDTDAVVTRARKHFEQALDLMADAPDPMRRARVLEGLSDALSRLGEDELAIPVAREALRTLRPTSAPSACRDVAARLGAILAEQDDWSAAAAAYRDAIEASELMFHRRLDTAGRETELRRAGNLARWAALASARAGDPASAAQILENSRAREIRRRLGLRPHEATVLAELPAELRRDYEAAIRNLVLAPIDAAGSGPGRRVQDILGAIRARPGFENFATGVRHEDLGAALEPGWPLLYVNPTPAGTMLLRVSDHDGKVRVVPTFLDRPTSGDIYMWLIAGASAEDETAEVASYLFSITGDEHSERDIQPALDQILPWLGESIARPIAACAAEVRAAGITLVLCGPLGLAPLHAATWREDGVNRSLLDLLPVRFAPSAALAATALERGSRASGPPSLVALGNPTGDLSAAEPEVTEIAALFPDGAAMCAFGAAANERFLWQNAAHTTHLHLACHATGAVIETADAGVRLADGVIPATRLTELADLETRVVAISACQSALSEISGMPHEAISIASTMLAAGSACSVASLWSVDDISTALLMVRFYSGLLQHGLRPPEALRAAQLWLRNLTEDDIQTFCASHPALAAEVRRRGWPTKERFSNRAVRSSSPHPYSHPDHWAAFVAVGA